MNYVQFHLGDWLSGTALLSPTERGVYMDLLVRYYKEERPILQEECKRIARAYAPTEQEAMQYVLQTFFTLDEDGYRHSRCDEEIEKARAVSDKRKRAASARWSKNGNLDAEAKQVHSKCIANGMLTKNQEPITNNHQIDKEINKEKPTKKTSAQKPDDISDSVWVDWVEHRKQKKASVSELVINGLRKEAEIAGLRLEEVMTIQVMNGWQGFRASWLSKDGVKGIPTHTGELTQEQRKQQGYGYDW